MIARYRTRYIFCGLAATVLTALPLAVGFSFGAIAGTTAGPASGGVGCNDCHPFESGVGSVELLDAPRRYRAGAMYDMTVRVSDVDQKAAGFEISAEKLNGAVGTLQIIDTANTQFADGDPAFVTHTTAGFNDALTNWASDGGSHDFFVGWDAPSTDVGRVTFFVSGNAVNHATSFAGDHFYWTYRTSNFAIPGDADGDTDLDLSDFAVFQQCFDVTGPVSTEACAFLDMDGDDWVADTDTDAFGFQMDGPTAINPAGYVLADAVRGGRLYDKWWIEAGLSAPTGDHPLYPNVGVQSGSTTFRCKECHGWDYKGVAGVYGSGSHFTGIPGVFGSTLTPVEMFNLLKADPIAVPNGHNMDALGLSDRDIWDVVRLVREELVDTDAFIDQFGSFMGDPDQGQFVYAITCTNCHGNNGTDINFGTTLDPKYVGTVAVDNPWEFLHKMRFGHPNSPMPAMELVGWSDVALEVVGAFAATLPTN